jgi:hypothetical protein
MNSLPNFVLAFLMWVFSRIPAMRELLATGFNECHALIDTIVTAHPAELDMTNALRPSELLELPKLTFQVIRRTNATLARKKGTVEDVQGVMRHSRTATTIDVYMHEIPESVQATVNSTIGS